VGLFLDFVSSSARTEVRAHMGRTCRWADEIELAPIQLKVDGSRTS